MQARNRTLATGLCLVLLAGCSGSSTKDKTIKDLQATIAAEQQRPSPTAQQERPPATAQQQRPSPTAQQTATRPVTEAAPLSLAPAATPSGARAAATPRTAGRAAAGVLAATPTPQASRQPGPFRVGAYAYKTFPAGNGLTLGMAQLYFRNATEVSLPGRTLDIKQVIVDSAEGKSFYGNYGIFDNVDSKGSYSDDLVKLIKDRLIASQAKLKDITLEDIYIGEENTFDAQENRSGIITRIPPLFPFTNVNLLPEERVVVAFLFDSSAHPTQIHIVDYDTTAYDSSLDSNTTQHALEFVPGTTPGGTIHPLSDLAAKRFATDNATLVYSGTCVLQDGVTGLPFTITNTSSTKSAEGRFYLPFAAYFNDSVIAFDGGLLAYTLDPGEQDESVDSIDRTVTSGSKTAPYSITFFEPDGVSTHYDLRNICKGS